jgi:hypothetical protein
MKPIKNAHSSTNLERMKIKKKPVITSAIKNYIEGAETIIG